jgi:hypothetical protein
LNKEVARSVKSSEVDLGVRQSQIAAAQIDAMHVRAEQFIAARAEAPTSGSSVQSAYIDANLLE